MGGEYFVSSLVSRNLLPHDRTNRCQSVEFDLAEFLLAVAQFLSAAVGDPWSELPGADQKDERFMFRQSTNKYTKRPKST